MRELINRLDLENWNCPFGPVVGLSSASKGNSVLCASSSKSTQAREIDNNTIIISEFIIRKIGLQQSNNLLPSILVSTTALQEKW